MSRDIDARFKPRDPIVERLEASRDIAHRERDAALLKVAELEAKLNRARRCLSSSRAAHELASQQWARERELMQFKLNFAAKHIRKHRQALATATK